MVDRPMSGIGLSGTVELRSVGRTTMLDYQLSTEPGEHLAVVGPNGAGKSTLLRLIAGLVGLDSGALSIGGVPVDDPAQGVFVAPADRPVVLQPQRGALFPHLDVAANVSYPLRAGGLSKKRARTDVTELLDRLGIADLASERVDDLSGGQLARVALARSLAAEPSILLLDEPAAALDKAATAELRHHLIDARCGLVVVTHDPVEAMLLGNRIAVVDEGGIAQVSHAGEIAAAPASGWTARLMGRNLVSGLADGSTVDLTGGGTIILAERHHGPVHISFAANAVVLHHEAPEGSARNVWHVRVTGMDGAGDRVRVSFTGDIDATALVTPAACIELGLGVGAPCWASVKATELSVIPA
jgi:molybdate transport system ATP-binding protein